MIHRAFMAYISMELPVLHHYLKIPVPIIFIYPRIIDDRCSSQYLRIYEDGAQISIQPRIEQYYLNERHADALEQSITRDSNILLRLKIWRGMYVVDGLTVDGQAY